MLGLGLGFGGNGGSGSTPVPLLDIRAIGANNRNFNAVETRSGKTVQVTRWPIVIGQDAATIIISNLAWYITNSAEGACPNGFEILDQAFESPSGDVVEFTFDSGASSSKTLAAGDNDIQTDPLLPSAFGLSEFPRGEIWWVKTRLLVSSGQSIPRSAHDTGQYTGSQSAWINPAVTTPSAITVAGKWTFTGTAEENRSNGYRPIVLGNPIADEKSFIIIGDSIGEGKADDANSQGAYGYGYMFRAMHDGSFNNPRPAINFARDSTESSVYKNGTRWKQYIQYVNNAIEEQGTNDIIRARSYSGIQTNLGLIWTALRDGGVDNIIRVELLPNTTSTDDWATTENQTVANYWDTGEEANNLNAWLATKVADGTLDKIVSSTSVRSPEDDNLWITDGTADYATDDGLHPKVATEVLMGEALRSIVDLEPFVLDNSPRITYAYDSLGNYARTQASATGGLNDQVEALFSDSNGTQDFSTDGCFLLKSVCDNASGIYYLIDDTDVDPDNWTRSSLYSTQLSALTSPASSSDGWIVFGGTNDANASSGVTKDAYKAGLSKLQEFVQADFPNVQFAILNILGRVGSGNDVNCQIVKEAILETIGENPFYYRGSEIYNQPYRDGSHPTDAAFKDAIALNDAKVLAYAYGIIPALGVYGPNLIPTLNGDINGLVNHDAGTDITVDAGCEDVFALKLGSNIYQPSLVSKVDATNIKVEFENKGLILNQDQTFYVGYGAMGGLTQATPETVEDNASTPAPLRTAVITPKNSEPIWQLSNLALCLDPKTSLKTYSSTDVTAITDNNNIGWTSAAGRYFEYADGFLTVPDTTTHMTSATISASANIVGGIVLDIPASVGSNSTIFSYGEHSRATLWCLTTGVLSWFVDDTLASIVISGDLRGQKTIVLWEFTENGAYGDANFYVNSLTPVTGLAHTAYKTQTSMVIGNQTAAGSNSLTDLGIGPVFHKTSVIGGSDPSISEIMTALASRYGVTLS